MKTTMLILLLLTSAVMADNHVFCYCTGETYISSVWITRNTSYGQEQTVELDGGALNTKTGVITFDSGFVPTGELVGLSDADSISYDAVIDSAFIYLFPTAVIAGGCTFDCYVLLKPAQEDSTTYNDWKKTDYEWGASGAAATGTYYNTADSSGPDRFAAYFDRVTVTTDDIDTFMAVRISVPAEHLDSLRFGTYMRLGIYLIPNTDETASFASAEHAEFSLYAPFMGVYFHIPSGETAVAPGWGRHGKDQNGTLTGRQ